MSSIDTKNGVPLKVRGDRVFNPSGENFGSIRGERVYGLDGSYRGIIVNDGGTYARPIPRAGAVSERGQPEALRAGRTVRDPRWGDEPGINP